MQLGCHTAIALAGARKSITYQTTSMVVNQFLEYLLIIIKYFSLGSHVMLATLGTTIGFLYSTATGNVPNQSSLIFSFGLNLFVVTFFVSLIKNLGESNLMCIMINKYLKGEDMHDDVS